VQFFQAFMASTSGPEVPPFKCFQTRWVFIYQERYDTSLSDDANAGLLCDVKTDIRICQQAAGGATASRRLQRGCRTGADLPGRNPPQRSAFIDTRVNAPCTLDVKGHLLIESIMFAHNSF